MIDSPGHFGRRLAVVGVIAAATAAIASESAAPSGAGSSYWGPIPPRAVAERQTPDDTGRPAWETAVNAPYWLATIPVELGLQGIAATVEHVDENPVLRRLLHLFPLKVGPAYLTAGVSAGGGDGFGGNLSVDAPRFFGEGKRLKIRGSAFTEGKGKAILGVDWPRSGSSGVEVGAGYRSDVEARFFGLGPDSREERKAEYHEEVSWVGVACERRFDSGIAWRGGALYSGASATGAGNPEEAGLAEEFAAELAAGEDAGRSFTGYRDRSDGATLSFELSHDDATIEGRPGTGRPEHGGLRRAKVAWFQGKGTSRAEFATYRVELQQFLPLPFSRRALALRGYGAWIEDLGDDPVPFQRLLTNDDPDLFRGFPDARFRDRGIAALSAEYRWPIWAMASAGALGADAYAFTDWGQVFEEPADAALDDLRASWGGGIRLAADPAFLGRIEVGFSEEAWVFRLRADQMFQAAGGGLFAGRDPVPDR